MTTNSDNKLQKIQPLGNGKYHINFNEREIESDGIISYNYDTIEVDSSDRLTIIEAIIASKYSVSDEIKILYRGTSEQIQEHEEWVAFCKEYVDNALKEFEDVGN